MTETDIPVVVNYRRWRSELIDAARDDEAHHRPISAARKRQAARLLLRAIVDEETNDQPSGLGGFGDTSGDAP